MKYIITYILIIVSYSSSLSQDYHKLISIDKSWDQSYAEMGYICTGFSDSPPIRFMVSGDTSINGLNYTKFSYQLMTPAWGSSPPNCPPFVVDTIKQEYLGYFLREDTITQKVWRYDISNYIEELLYDFSLDKGDTLYHTLGSPTIIDTVYEIVTDDGKTRRKLELEGFYGGYYIEGIGGTAGLFEQPYEIFEEGTWMMCVKQNSSIIWQVSNDCYDLITSIGYEESTAQINVFPNPAKDLINIEGVGVTSKVRIYNSIGECCIVCDLEDHKIIYLDCLRNGVYFLQIEQKDKIYREIIIKE